MWGDQKRLFTYFLWLGEIQVVHDVHKLLQTLSQPWVKLALLPDSRNRLTWCAKTHKQPNTSSMATVVLTITGCWTSQINQMKYNIQSLRRNHMVLADVQTGDAAQTRCHTRTRTHQLSDGVRFEIIMNETAFFWLVFTSYKYQSSNKKKIKVVITHQYWLL